MNSILSLLLLVLATCSYAKFIAVLGPKTEIAEFNITSGNMTKVGSFISTPPQKHQQWQVTNFKAVDAANQRIYFAYEDIINSVSAVFYYDIATGKYLQGLRGLHFDVKQKRLFSLTDYEPGRVESAVLELNTNTLDKKGVIVSVSQFGVINMPSTFDQTRGWISFTTYNFSSDTHRLVTVDTRQQGEGAIISSPQLDKNYWHILTIAFDENNQRMIALWNQNSYAPLKMYVIDRATGAISPTYNVTIINWRNAHDAMSDSPISFAKDYQKSQLISVITGKSFTQHLVVLDLATVSVVAKKTFPYPGVGYDIVFAYLE